MVRLVPAPTPPPLPSTHGLGLAAAHQPSPDRSFHCPCDSNLGPSVGSPLHQSWAKNSSEPQESPPQAETSPLLQFRVSSYLCGLEHREPLKAFMGGVWGAATPIARPGSSLSCILSREGVGCGVTLPRPGLLPTSQGYTAFPPTSQSLEEAGSSCARASSQPRDRIQVSCIAGGFFTI